MAGDAETVHVAWGESRAGSVRVALRLQGCDARVVALSKALNLGPLDPDGRRAWFDANLRADDAWDEPEAPWTEATAAGLHPVYWVCLTDAAEHASFLAFASRMAGRPFDIVDATGLDLTRLGGGSPVRSLGRLRPEDIVASGLGGKRRPFSRAEGDAASVAWSRLRLENAPLRVVRGGHLVSAPLTHFDAVLTGHATRDGEMVVELIGRVLHHLSCEAEPGQGCDGEFLFGRVLALGTAGALDLDGPGPGMRDYRVCRPSSDGPPSSR